MSQCKWTEEELEKFRQQADPLADDTVELLYRSQGDRQRVNDLWDTLLHNDQVPPEDTPPEVAEYLKKSGELPPWADLDMLREAEEFFMENGPFCLVGLLAGSLPECYLMKNGVQVLWATARLEDHVERRLFETAQMVVSVMQPRGLCEEGRGIRTVQKVRLMHAAIRHLILQPKREYGPDGPRSFRDVLQSWEWDSEKLGKPINQEDMAYTLLTFSYVILRAVETLGMDVTIREKNAFIHCWNVVGHLLGIDTRLMAGDYYEAHELFNRIKRHQGGQCPQGVELTAALLRCQRKVLRKFAVIPYVFGAWKLPKIVAREIVGPETSTMLGIPPLNMSDYVARELGRWSLDMGTWFWEDLSDRAARHFGSKIVRSLTRLPRQRWKRELFDLPRELSTWWGIKY